MSFWSDLLSRKKDSRKNLDAGKVSIEESLEELKATSSNKSYDEFDKQPGKSVPLLNKDSYWKRFVQYESDNEEELVARFKRQEFENYFLNTAYKRGIIKSNKIENCDGLELNISVNEIITTYLMWANKNEPIININARILDTKKRPGLNRLVFEYTYLVRSPFAGILKRPDHQEEKQNDRRLYYLYTVHRTKELWPQMPTDLFHDDLDRLPFVRMNFNEFLYDEHFREGFPFWDWEAEGKLPCLRYEWKIQNYATVNKGQLVCIIIKNPYDLNKKEYKIYSPVSGIISIGLNGKKTEYKYVDEMHIFDLFSIYKDKITLINLLFLQFDEIKEIDDFDGTVSLAWEKVAGRELTPVENDLFPEGYKGFEMVADSGQYIIVSLQVKSNIPYISFSFNSKMIQLSNGDYVDLQFEDYRKKSTILSFQITRNHTSDIFADIYDVSYFCELSQNDIECMKKNNCVRWRIRFNKQPLMSIVGINESRWCPKEYAGVVFKEFVSRFIELIEELRHDYAIEFTSPRVSSASAIIAEACYVYLMYDSTNGYYKIGISNQPEYREKTLQSEKPSIEKICAKSFPNRTIAGAIESALHKAYDSKRLRGEWFNLDDNDVKAIISTLS